MSQNNSIVAIYPTHTAAEAAVKELQQAGFDMKKLRMCWHDLLPLRKDSLLTKQRNGSRPTA